MRETAGSAAALAARCRNCRRGSFILNPPSLFTSFDHLVGAQQERLGDCQPERLGGCKIDDEIKLGRLLDRDVAWLRPAQNLVDILGRAPEHTREGRSVGNETPGLDKIAGIENHWQPRD